jgi:hypothetical protein
MTVAELIEKLQQLPGDPDLRAVVFYVTVHRPYAADARMHCAVTTIQLEHDVVAICAHGYLE